MNRKWRNQIAIPTPKNRGGIAVGPEYFRNRILILLVLWGSILLTYPKFACLLMLKVQASVTSLLFKSYRIGAVSLVLDLCPVKLFSASNDFRLLTVPVRHFCRKAVLMSAYNLKKKKKKKKKRYTPVNFSFTIIKVGYKGVYISRTCYPDVYGFFLYLIIALIFS